MATIQVLNSKKLLPAIHNWKIHIEDLQINCPIGVYKDEYGRNQKICINIVLAYSTFRNNSTTYKDVICYDSLIQRIEKICTESHTELIEELILKIVDDLVSDNRIDQLDIKITKLEAISATKSVGLSYKFQRAANTVTTL